MTKKPKASEHADSIRMLSIPLCGFIYIIIICTKQPTSKFVVDNTMGSVL